MLGFYGAFLDGSLSLLLLTRRVSIDNHFNTTEDTSPVGASGLLESQKGSLLLLVMLTSLSMQLSIYYNGKEQVTHQAKAQSSTFEVIGNKERPHMQMLNEN